MAIRRRRKKFVGRVREQRTNRLNQEITAPEVRIVGHKDESVNGVKSTRSAISLARELKADLIEINGNVSPPIVKVMEYSKFRYEKRKREKENKAKQQEVKIKEIRFGPNTDEHDFNFKLKHAQRFLEEGNKVKAYVQFRGRSIVHPDRGRKMLLEFAQELIEIGKIEHMPKLQGKRMHLILAPK